MENRKKHPGGAEKMRLKKLKSLEVEAAKCSKLTDLFGSGVTTSACAAAPGRRARGGIYGNVSLGLARLHFETCPKLNRKRFYIECDVINDVINCILVTTY